MVHVYNAWLPGPVADQVHKEGDAFANVVNHVKSAWIHDKPNSSFATLKWVPIIYNFIEARSDIALTDVQDLIATGLDLFFQSECHHDVQIRWGNLISKLIRKFGKKLDITLEWRPFYDLLVKTHFTRNINAEGLRPRQHHLEAIRSLISSCRTHFSAGAATEIWSEFRPLMGNLWHNSSLEAAGFIQLFLPTNKSNSDFFNNDLVADCLKLWMGMPNCQFWDFQWSAIMARCIKHCSTVDWEDFLPVLFTYFLNIIEVPVANNSASYPFSREDIPRKLISAFCSGRLVKPTKEIAKAIIYLLKPDGYAQMHFEKLVGLLEQYYHPSNGGRWSYSLEHFLRCLMYYFRKRLVQEQCKKNSTRPVTDFLQHAERRNFVKTVLKLIDRGQYSKNESLSDTTASAACLLSYIEPTIVLPSIISSFHISIDNVTSPHQFKSAISMMALTNRALLLASVGVIKPESEEYDSELFISDCKQALISSMCNTLLGLDVNDPPKTLAIMQLFGSMFSSLSKIGGKDGDVMVLGFDMSEWLDEFFCRLFSLFLHLEPNNQINEGEFLSSSSGTFLVENAPFYFCLVQILLGKLTVPLYQQALKKVAKFVHGHILPGAVEEIGALCGSILYSNPKEAFSVLLLPMIESITSSLRESPSTGFAAEKLSYETFEKEVSLSPALEESVVYQLNILSASITYGGSVVSHHKKELNEVILAAFNAPSLKVNKAANFLLRSLFGCLILYYPLEQYKCQMVYPEFDYIEKWISIKEEEDVRGLAGPTWHIPDKNEIAFANELLDLHFRSALGSLKELCEGKHHITSDNRKKILRVILLQIDASLQGVRSCLPELPSENEDTNAREENTYVPFISGSCGVQVGDNGLRQYAAEVIDMTCKFMLEHIADNSMLMILLVHILDALVNYGSLEYDDWLSHRQAWEADSSVIVEPAVNFLTGQHAQSKRRPRWALIDRTYIHNMWRASQSSYHKFRVNTNLSPSKHVVLLMNNLLALSVGDYDTIRRLASKSVIKLLKRIPSLLKINIPKFVNDLRKPEASENHILGTCKLLSSRVVMKHMMKDWESFSSFLLAIVESSHHDTLKAQKAINELFIAFNMRFTGTPKIKSHPSSNCLDKSEYEQLIVQIKTLVNGMNGMNWRYNLMAHRVLFLLAFPSNENSEIASEIRSEIACHFLLQLKSHLPPVRVLSAASLLVLLRSSPGEDESNANLSKISIGTSTASFASVLLSVIEDGAVSDLLTGLSYDHNFPDEANNRPSNMQDGTLHGWMQSFYSPWPRSRNWNNLLKGDAFLPVLAKLFKSLVQECGQTILQLLQNPLEEFVTKTEPGKQCVASEVLAGLLHSDASSVIDAWDDWLCGVLRKGLHNSTVETTGEWAAGVRFAVTGKGRNGKTIPLMRQKVIECLAEPLPASVSTRMVARRFTLLCSVFVELSPPSTSYAEIAIQVKLLEEAIDFMDHSVAQVRESIGDLLAVICSNLRLSPSFMDQPSGLSKEIDWSKLLMEKAAACTDKIHQCSQTSLCNGEAVASDGGVVASDGVKADKEEEISVKWMETVFYFVISALRSGRAPILDDVIVGLFYPIISLQETSHKEMSKLAKTALHILQWKIISQPNVSNAIEVILASSNDTSWHTRLATLKFLHSFMYRHTFLLTSLEMEKVWNQTQTLLKDNQVEVREQAASVLSGLIRGADYKLFTALLENAHKEATLFLKRINSRNPKTTSSLAARHGVVLALASLILSVPYDIPSWLPDTITLLARFIGEPYPIRSTVMKTVAEFRRTHADTWAIQKDKFTEDQLEVLSDFSSSLSYFS